MISISILLPSMIILGNEFGAEGIATAYVLSQSAYAIFLVFAAKLLVKKWIMFVVIFYVKLL